MSNACRCVLEMYVQARITHSLTLFCCLTAAARASLMSSDLDACRTQAQEAELRAAAALMQADTDAANKAQQIQDGLSEISTLNEQIQTLQQQLKLSQKSEQTITSP